MRTIITLIIIIALLGLGAFIYAWTGSYNIAATESHWSLTESFIDMLKNRSIASHSGDIRAPDLDKPEMRQKAMPHYHGMCRHCHGAPGYAPKEFAPGLYPSPPPMASGHIQEHYTNAELYWIVKHGIKMTGMPAFGKNHSENQIRGLVAIAREMPEMTSEQYRKAAEQMSEEGHHGGGHQHSEEKEKDPGDHDHGQKTEPKAHETEHAH